MKTASAAEAWALMLSLRENPNPVPARILTDCLGLVIAAKAGPHEATKGKKADARIWKIIDNLTKDSFRQLTANLIWMPAHTTAGEAALRVKSNGKELTSAEWRANDVADKLAKRGAMVSQLREAADKEIKVAGNALKQVAARVGAVTLAANCHRTDYTKEDGQPAFRIDRDSSSMPLALAKEKHARSDNKQALAPAVPPPPPYRLTARPLQEPTFQQRKRAERSRHAALAAAAQVTAVASLAAQAAAKSQPQASSAADRMAALRARRGLAHHAP